MFGRPNLHTSYQSEASMLPTWTQRLAAAALLLVGVTLPFQVPVLRDIPVLGYLGDPDWIRLTTTALIFALAAIGLNLLTGVAGQVSLGHAFFMGVGAYTAVYLGGESRGTLWGHGLPMWVWLPGAGVGAALVGIIVAPTAVRLRGLYLAIVTVGLVAIGTHLSRVLPEIAGPAERGRRFPPLEFRWWKEEEAVVSFRGEGRWFGFLDVNSRQSAYLFAFVLLVVAVLVSKNLIRTRTGRALQAIRDRDVAAEVMGVPEVRYKLIAFALSSAIAGIAGALYASFIGQLNPEYWDLLLSVEFIAIVLIGGAGTTAGPVLGALFVVLIPEHLEKFVHWMSVQAGRGGPWGGFWNLLVSTNVGDFGFVAGYQPAPGFPIPAEQLKYLLFGVMIIVFLLFEPRGLFGIWTKIRNYWKGWPFTY